MATGGVPLGIDEPWETFNDAKSALTAIEWINNASKHVLFAMAPTLSSAPYNTPVPTTLPSTKKLGQWKMSTSFDA